MLGECVNVAQSVNFIGQQAMNRQYDSKFDLFWNSCARDPISTKLTETFRLGTAAVEFVNELFEECRASREANHMCAVCRVLEMDLHGLLQTSISSN